MHESLASSLVKERSAVLGFRAKNSLLFVLFKEENAFQFDKGLLAHHFAVEWRFSSASLSNLDLFQS